MADPELLSAVSRSSMKKSRRWWQLGHLRSLCRASVFRCVAALFYLVVVPYQLAYELQTHFSALYALGYVLDVGMCWLTCRALFKMALKAKAKVIADEQAQRVDYCELFSRFLPLFLCTPWDGALWFSTGTQELVPWVRLPRLLYAAPQVSTQLHYLEVESAGLSYFQARALRLIVLVLFACHIFSCWIFELSQTEGVLHYVSAPWVVADVESENVGSLYLRSFYWVFISLTTVGRKNIVSSRGTDQEVILALIICILVTLVYFFVVGNATALLLKRHQQVDLFRSKLAAVEEFLSKRRIRASVSKLVRQHVKDSWTRKDMVDESFLKELPQELRNEVLRDINMKLLQQAPIFYSCQAKVLEHLCSTTERCVFMQNEVLVEAGAICSEILLLHSGIAVSSTPGAMADAWEASEGKMKLGMKQGSVRDGMRAEGTISRFGSALGAESFLFGQAHSSTLIAAVRTICMSIKREGFTSALALCVSDAAIIRHNTIDLATEERAAELCKVEEKWHNRAVTKLLYASARGEVEKVQCMLTDVWSAELKASDADYAGRTALHLAASSGNTVMMKLLIDHKANVNMTDRNGNTPLHDAFKQGQMAAAQMLRSLKGTLGYSRKRMGTELCTAVRESEIHIIRQLLEFHCDPNAVKEDGRTCLHVAAAVGNATIAELLLDKGAKPDPKDNQGITPLLEAVRNGSSAVVTVLRSRGATLGLSNTACAAELNRAVRNANLKMLEQLLFSSADPNLSDYDGRTCLHVAAANGNVTMVEYLLQKGVDPNHRDRWGSTPLTDSVCEMHEKVTEVLLRARWDTFTLHASADPNMRDEEGRTVLHVAATQGNLEIVKLLLKAGVDTSIQDKWGVTARECADRLDFPRLAKMI